MTIEIKVPQLPESVTDAMLVAWHKKPGDPISRDENLVDLETDKVVLEVPAPVNGTLVEIKIMDGTTVTSGEVLAIIEEGGSAAVVAPADESSSEVAKLETSVPVSGGDSAHKLSPSVRRLLDEHDLDATIVIGSGKDGRITKSDIMEYLKSHSDENVAPGDPAPPPRLPSP